MQKAHAWYGFLVVIVPTFLSIIPFNEAAQRDEYDDFWAKSDSDKVYYKFLQECRAKGVRVDEHKLYKDLKECQRPVFEKALKSKTAGEKEKQVGNVKTMVQTLMTGRALTQSQTDHVQDDVKLMCEALLSVSDCSKEGRDYLLKQCASDYELIMKVFSYMELILQSACRNNGKRIADFLTTNGISCISSYKKPGEKCGKHIAQKMNSTFEDDHDKLCEITGLAHKCASTAVESCPEKEPTKALQSILDEVHQSWTSTTCSAPRIGFYHRLLFVVLSLFGIMSLFA